MNKLTPEKLDQTWLLDIDGTVFKHRTNIELDKWINDFKTKSHLKEELLSGVKQWFKKLSSKDSIVFITAREKRHKAHTERALKKFGIKFNHIIYGVNAGPRILINDIKPAASNEMKRDIETAFAINLKRDSGFEKVPLCFL
jgi:uncharacterized HAD superfamily protein